MAAYQYIYVMKGLNKTYPGGKQVLKDIWLSFFPGAKIGVLGLNGAGKSTLLRIMAGQDDNFTGEAWAAEGVKVGFLEQEPKLDAKKDVLGNVMDGAGEMARMLARFEEVSNAFSDPDADMDKLIAEQAELQEKIDAGNGWDLGRTVEIAMDALRCPPGDAEVETLSGGERRRVALCRLTISTPNRWPGWSAISASSRAPSWPSPTIATSSTMSPAGSSSSIAAPASRGRATTRPG
jgi:ATPase subunit of ABC transporter with duplicated ATPase domains